MITKLCWGPKGSPRSRKNMASAKVSLCSAEKDLRSRDIPRLWFHPTALTPSVRPVRCHAAHTVGNCYHKRFLKVSVTMCASKRKHWCACFVHVYRIQNPHSDFGQINLRLLQLGKRKKEKTANPATRLSWRVTSHLRTFGKNSKEKCYSNEQLHRNI